MGTQRFQDRALYTCIYIYIGTKMQPRSVRTSMGRQLTSSAWRSEVYIEAPSLINATSAWKLVGAWFDVMRQQAVFRLAHGDTHAHCCSLSHPLQGNLYIHQYTCVGVWALGVHGVALNYIHV